MRKIKVLIAAVVLLLCGVCFSGTKYIDWALGDDGNAGTSAGAGNAWKTFGEALSSADDGDIIHVAANTSYVEEGSAPNSNMYLYWNQAKSLTFIGSTDNAADTVLTCVAGQTRILRYVYAGHNTIKFKNISLVGVASTTSVLYLNGTDTVSCSLELDNCVVSGGTTSSIQGETTDGQIVADNRRLVIKNSAISGPGSGAVIRLSTAKSISIMDSTVEQTNVASREPIMFLGQDTDYNPYQTKDIKIINTIFKRTSTTLADHGVLLGRGMQFAYFDKCKILNTSDTNTSNIALIIKGENAIIRNSVIEGNRGLYFKGGKFGKVINNVIIGTGLYGVQLEEIDATARAIDTVDQVNNTFTHNGADRTAEFQFGMPIEVTGSTGNDREYTVVGSEFTGGNTVVTVKEAIPNAVADGNMFEHQTFEATVFENNIIDGSSSEYAVVYNNVSGFPSQIKFDYNNYQAGSLGMFFDGTAARADLTAIKTIWAAQTDFIWTDNDENSLEVDPQLDSNYRPANTQIINGGRFDINGDKTYMGAAAVMSNKGLSGIFYNGFFK